MVGPFDGDEVGWLQKAHELLVAHAVTRGDAFAKWPEAIWLALVERQELRMLLEDGTETAGTEAGERKEEAKE